jgi:Spy/CpxP family protein refolding chaperone
MFMKAKTVLLLSLVCASSLVAADENRPARRGPDGAVRAQSGFGGPLSSVGAFEKVLTEEQRQKLREYTQANSEKARSSQQEAMKMRRELQEAVLNGEADEAAVKQKTDAIAKLEAEVLAARLSAMAKVAATFTPEQKQKVRELGEQMRARGAAGRERQAGTAGEPAAPAPPAK